MASVCVLNQRIDELTRKNKELNDEYDEYQKLKGELGKLIEAHLQCQKQSRTALAGAGLQPSRCMNSFIEKMNAQLDSAADQIISNNISSLVDSAAKEQRLIMQEIDQNDNQIRAYRRQINLQKKKDDLAVMEE